MVYLACIALWIVTGFFIGPYSWLFLIPVLIWLFLKKSFWKYLALTLLWLIAFTLMGPWALIFLLPLLVKELSKSGERTTQAGSQSEGEPEPRIGVQPLTEFERQAIERQERRTQALRPTYGPVILSRSEFPAGFCLKCGRDSLWEIHTQYEKHGLKKWFECKMCDPSIPERRRKARTDRVILD